MLAVPEQWPPRCNATTSPERGGGGGSYGSYYPTGRPGDGGSSPPRSPTAIGSGAGSLLFPPGFPLPGVNVIRPGSSSIGARGAAAAAVGGALVSEPSGGLIRAASGGFRRRLPSRDEEEGGPAGNEDAPCILENGYVVQHSGVVHQVGSAQRSHHVHTFAIPACDLSTWLKLIVRYVATALITTCIFHHNVLISSCILAQHA